jgi:hypothetical protein
MATARARLAFVLVLAGAAGLGVAADPSAERAGIDADTLKTMATRVIDRLAAGEFAAALEAFDRSPGGGVTADTLREEWQKAVGQAGPLRGRTAARVHDDFRDGMLEERLRAREELERLTPVG